MPDPYDLIVLGTGSAAFKVATRCREAGWQVVVVGEPPFGGTCALHGCEPKKTLWTIAEAVDRARRLAGNGLALGAASGEGLGIDWPALMAFKRSFTDPVPDNRRHDFAEAGIETIEGTGRFVGPHAVEVAGHRLEAKHILIATGARPASLPLPGAALLAISDDFLALERLPRRLLLLGGGYISFEFAHIAARAGAQVTILHGDEHPLAQFDPELVERLVRHTRRLGIQVELDCPVTAIARDEAGFTVQTEDGRRFEADLAVHGLGRVPNIGALNLEAAGIASEKGRLRLDDFLRSVSNPAVFAAGDAAAKGPPLTPVASLDAEVVARNLLEGCHQRPDYTGVVSTVFTIPPLAAVGLTEAAARKQGLRVSVKAGDMASYQSVRRVGETSAAYKVLIEEGTSRVLGAHLIGPQAEEVINLFALAIRHGLPAEALSDMLTAYPSGGSNVSGMLQ